jgi:hypothetical protein
MLTRCAPTHTIFPPPRPAPPHPRAHLHPPAQSNPLLTHSPTLRNSSLASLAVIQHQRLQSKFLELQAESRHLDSLLAGFMHEAGTLEQSFHATLSDLSLRDPRGQPLPKKRYTLAQLMLLSQRLAGASYSADVGVNGMAQRHNLGASLRPPRVEQRPQDPQYVRPGQQYVEHGFLKQYASFAELATALKKNPDLCRPAAVAALGAAAGVAAEGLGAELPGGPDGAEMRTAGGGSAGAMAAGDLYAELQGDFDLDDPDF